jgi:hypothetical protein
MRDWLIVAGGLVVGGVVGYWLGFQGGIYFAHFRGIDNFNGEIDKYATIGSWAGMAVLAVVGGVAAGIEYGPRD